MGANGHPLLRTPHLDRLAREGVNCAHAFCPIPLCVPARSCFLAGTWTSRHGAIANWDTEAFRPMVEGLPTWSQVLRDAGYQAAYIGKWHVDKDRGPAHFGFQDCVDEGEYAAWRRQQGIPHVAVDWTRAFGEVDPHVRPDQTRLAHQAGRAIEFIEKYAAGGAPFCVRWDPPEPHLPNLVPEPYASLYPLGDIPPWPSFPDPLTGKPYAQRQQRLTWRVEGWTWEQWAPVVGRYLGEVTLLDAQVGRILDTLDRLGLAENTLVSYTTDHGDMCGGHGMLDKHMVMYDDVVRVPLILRWPGVLPAGVTCDGFICNALDLAATLCSAARCPIPSTFQGMDLLPILRGERPGRADIFATYHGNQFGLYSQRMVRDVRWKYIWNATAEDELYDLATDPGELVNRALDPSAAGELARLRARLLEWMQETGDRLLNIWTRQQLTPP